MKFTNIYRNITNPTIVGRIAIDKIVTMGIRHSYEQHQEGNNRRVYFYIEITDVNKNKYIIHQAGASNWRQPGEKFKDDDNDVQELYNSCISFMNSLEC